MLECPISLICMLFWDVGGNLRSRRKPTQTRGEHANSTQKQRCLCEAVVLIIEPTCCPKIEEERLGKVERGVGVTVGGLGGEDGRLGMWIKVEWGGSGGKMG